MDWIGILLGIIGAGGITYLGAMKKIKYVENMIEDMIKIHTDMKKIISEYENIKDKKDMSKDDIDGIMADLKDLSENMENIYSDYKKIKE